MPVITHLRSILHEILFQDGCNRRDAGCTGDRIATKGRTMVTCCKDVSAWTRQHCTYRYAASQPFCHCHHIRHHVKVFPTKEFPSSPHACLYLITDHYQVLLITPLAYTLDILLIRCPDTAFALYRL